MTDPIPTAGRIVLYRLKQTDVDQINAARKDKEHRWNDVRAGQEYPMLIVRPWGIEPTSAVNGRVFLDGVDAFWATSVAAGPEGERVDGFFYWPQRT